MKRIRLAVAVMALAALSASATASSTNGTPPKCLVSFPGSHFLTMFLPG